MTIIKVTISALLRRASQQDCEKFQQPLGTYELLDPNGDRIAWIDGNLKPRLAEQKAYDLMAEPLLEDFYNLDDIPEDL